MKSELDKEGMYNEIALFSDQCKEAFSHNEKVKGSFDKIIICGMGGSAIAGDLLKHLIDMEVFVVRDYVLPKIIDKHTLLIAVSYSGNTEETISCLKESLGLDCKVAVITSGGKAEDIAKQNQLAYVNVPKGHQPRAALSYLLFSLLRLLDNSKIMDAYDDVNEAIQLIEDNIEELRNIGKSIAEKCVFKVPVVYASDKMSAVAERWKTQFNENAKQMAFWNEFSEMNHNEILGYTLAPNNFLAILLRDDKDNERIKKRMDISKELMSKVPVEEVYAKGNSLLARMIYLTLIGDWASYFAAIQNEVDPTPVEIIENLKKKLVE